MAGVCRTGAATNIISGLAFGFFGNIIPVVLVTTVGFVSYFWLGSFGVGLLAVGFSLLIPNYLAMDCFFSIVDTCSKIGHINRINENSLEALVCLA